jgi:hypothetical protein
MRILINILTFSFVFGVLYSKSLNAQLLISDPISVTDGDISFGRMSPKLALNENGELLVFWMRTANKAFFISTLIDGEFSTPTQIPFGGLNPNMWNGSLGPNMASHGDHVYVTFEVYGDAIYVTHSSDGGTTWDLPVSAIVPPTGRRATIPTIAVDTEGQPYIAYVNTNASEQDAYYGMVKSENFGQNFLAEVNASENTAGTEVCECCNGHISVDSEGNVYIAFRNNNNNLRDNWLVKSTDGGASFESAFDVDETDWMISACPTNGPNFAIMDDLVSTTGPEGLTEDPFLLTSLPSSQQFASIIYDGEFFHTVYEDNASNTLLYQNVGFGNVNVKEDNDLSFSIQPNPATNVVQLTRKTNKLASILIIDIYGRTLFSDSTLDKKTNLDVSNLITGFYTIVVIEGNEFSQMRLSVIK